MVAAMHSGIGMVEPVTGGGKPQTANNTSPSPKPTADVQISDATPADAHMIAAVGGQVFAASFGHSVQAEDLTAYLKAEYTTEAFEKELRDPKTSTWIARDARDGKTLLGFTQLCRQVADPCLKDTEDVASLAQLHRHYVDTNVHGSGTGSRLITRAIDTARAEGFRKIWLTVWEHNPRAERLYARFGFVRVAKTSFFVGKEEQWDWVMVKDLQQ